MQTGYDIDAAEQRLEPANRLSRYAHGRIRFFWMRQILTLVGAVSLGVFISPYIGLTAAGLALLGELIDCGCLWYVIRQLNNPENYAHCSRLVVLSGAIQALTISLCVLLAWFTAEEGQAVHFSMTFLAAAALNAGIAWPFHPDSAKTKLSLYGVTAIIGFARDIRFTETVEDVNIFNALGHILLIYVVCVVLMHIVQSNARHQKRTRELLASAKSLEATHERLIETQIDAHRLSLVAKHANDSVIISDGSSRITWVNAAFEKITGYTAGDAIGRTPSDLLNGPDSDAKTTEDIKVALQKGEPFRTEILNYRKDGRPIWVDTNLVPVLSSDGKVTMVIAIERDITSLKRHEEELATARVAAERGEQAKSEFLATMSHEIRTPMNSIIGLADLLTTSDLPEEAARYATTIQSSAEALLKIINDVLDFSKLDAGEISVDPIAFDLRTCVREAVMLFEAQAAAKGVFLETLEDQSLPPIMIGDDGRIRQILVNLIGNALKFTERGSVSLRTYVDENDDHYDVKISIEDTGIGIAPEQMDAIFDKFSQADGQITRRFGGTGLGLAISRLLAQRMGGDISVKSELNSGSTFTVTLKLGKDSDLSPNQTNEVFADKDVGYLSVLVAEDNKTNRFLISKYLMDLPIDLRFAVDGREAVDATASVPPDVIFMDMSMPRMDGLEATRLIRSRKGKQPKIIALTANAFASDRAACFDAGMDDFLAKPVRKSDLISKLAQISSPTDPPKPHLDLEN